jgi:protein-disulfide isomerase
MHDTLSCPIAPRLASFACWLASGGKDSAFIAEKLIKRYKSFAETRKYTIVGSLFPPAGDTTAPVTITVYISISCPRCKQVSGFLYDSVTTGSLKGKAQLHMKLLTVNERDMALLAAAQSGVFWDYFKRLTTISKRLDMPVLYDVAQEMHLQLAPFKEYINDKNLQKRAQASRKEAHANGVKVTPTLFINGHRYYSYDHPIWIVDRVDYEYRQLIKKDKNNHQR